MAKRLSEKQKEEIVRKFKEGKSIDALAKDFNYTKITISRHLKKNLEEYEYKSLISNNFSLQKNPPINQKRNLESNNNDQLNVELNNGFFNSREVLNIDLEESENSKFSTFTEIIPLNEDIENLPQKDLSSVPISEITFPNMAYMVVDKKIELEIKTLRDYPEWQFLSENELCRKTIEIFLDLKNAKRKCSKNQKVIKVPNTKVFEIAAPILTSKGISRIISENTLIAL